MTDSFDTAPDPADRPRRAAPPAEPMHAAAFRPARPGRAGRVLRWWLAASALLAVACAVCIAVGIGHFDFAPVHIVIDGDDFTDGFAVQGLGDGGRALLGVVALLAASLAILLLPVFILALLAILLVALVAVLGLPLLGLAIALGVLTSPLWLVGLVVWLVVRDRHPVPRPAPSATMNA
jgi:hypothetical protein